MQRAFDRPDRQESRTQWKWTAGLAVAFMTLALVALVSNSPKASNWVSDAAQAEFASSTVMPLEQVQVAADRTH